MTYRRVFIVCLAVGAVALLYVWQRTEVVSLGYDVQRLRIQKGELAREHKLLQFELSTLKAPERIERIAREQLRMVVPDRVEIVGEVP